MGLYPITGNSAWSPVVSPFGVPTLIKQTLSWAFGPEPAQQAHWPWMIATGVLTLQHIGRWNGHYDGLFGNIAVAIETDITSPWR